MDRLSFDTSSEVGRRLKTLLDENVREVRSPALCNDPVVSVWLLTFNHKRFIKQAVDSALTQQTDFPYEIVIGDDCSNDGTSEIVNDYYERQSDKIRLLLASKNLWNPFPEIAGTATAVALYEACRRGRYIAILEGDDYWTDPLKIQKQVDFLDAHPECAMCFHDLVKVDAGGNVIARDVLPRGMKRTLTQNEVAMSMYPVPPTVTMMMRRRCVEHLPDWYFRMPFGDRCLAITATQYGKGGYVDMVAAAYRIHPGGIASGATVAKRALMDIESRKLVLANVEMTREGRKFHFRRITELYLRSIGARRSLSRIEQLRLIRDLLFFASTH